ncbi:hypothetical protein CPIN18020_0321 [Campylobacter pinnipediorum subsp. caledonicus]|uniref:hypothetical protein n=1 Tax=Campylobacter pinnipediorum TaxID=1965231 RepID=UPI0009958BDF|nr:hypothetical protein [Campylobacter pinnipediorum]AQW85562.1 hypothetical protein CPIN18020_0321 [Campylobacter pinnipediorum subsp. caledonicus]
MAKKEIKEELQEVKQIPEYEYIRGDELSKKKADIMLEYISKGVYWRDVIGSAQLIAKIPLTGGMDDDSLKAINGLKDDEFITDFVQDVTPLVK